MTPRPDLKARVLAAAAQQSSMARPAASRRRALGWAGAGLWMLLVFGGIGGMRAVERPVAFVLGTAAGWAIIALAATLGGSRGTSMLGRPLGVLLAVVVATPLALEAWYAAWVLRAEMVGPSSLGVLPCVAASLAMAAAPFTLLLLQRRGSCPNHPRTIAATMGALSGAWGAVLIDLHCDHADLLHVTLGHVLPALLLSLVGFAIGGRVLSLREP